MATLRPGDGRAAWAWSAVSLLAEVAAFAALLFVTRFVARGHLVPQSDQECHIGGIAVDVLAHGVRFPLLAYAPNEYDNGSFFSGLLAALSFLLFGRNVLALKLVTHVISAVGAVATLWLLRGCLQELGLTRRPTRWAATGALVVGLAIAPRVVTLCSLNAVGNHAEGTAIDMVLLAMFSRRRHPAPDTRTMGLWALVGFALYLNKGTALVIPVLAAIELALAWSARGPRVAAALGGFLLGGLPELMVIAQRHGLGWATIAAKEERYSQAFPRPFFESLLVLGEYRLELLAAWAVALVVGAGWLIRLARRRGLSDSAEGPPVALAMVVGCSVTHLLLLTTMAQGGLDAYVIYGYPTLVVLYALLVASVCERAARAWGERAAAWVGMAALAVTAVLYRPEHLTWGFGKASALWHNHVGAACSWRFAEGFEREHDHGLAPPGKSREQHAIERCRTLSEPDQILDCIGGIARELGWRRGGKVDGQPPAGLTAGERHAYAYLYGTHRKGNVAPCGEFDSAELAADCAGAVRLECLVFADMYTRLVAGEGLRSPRCTIPAPPMDGYWAAWRWDLLTRTGGIRPQFSTFLGHDTDLAACRPVFDECF